MSEEPENQRTTDRNRTDDPAQGVGARDARRGQVLESLGSRVRALRQGRSWSQRALAKEAGLSARFIAQIEAGQGNISVGKLAEVARGLGTTPAVLLMPSGEGGGAAEPTTVGLREEIALLVEPLPVTALRHLRDSLRGGKDWSEEGLSPLIALVGLRGAGKSTLGPLLAEGLGCPYLELDEAIQDATGLALSELFELHGEGYYRQAERSTLEGLLAREVPMVVAVSGGAVSDPETFRLLRRRTTMVWVKATPEEHMARVVSQGDRRPMSNRQDAMAELKALLAARTPYYAQARLIADTSKASPEANAERLRIALQRMD